MLRCIGDINEVVTIDAEEYSKFTRWIERLTHWPEYGEKMCLVPDSGRNRLDTCARKMLKPDKRRAG